VIKGAEEIGLKRRQAKEDKGSKLGTSKRDGQLKKTIFLGGCGAWGKMCRVKKGATETQEPPERTRKKGGGTWGAKSKQEAGSSKASMEFKKRLHEKKGNTSGGLEN